MKKIRLAENTIPNENIDMLREWLAEYPRLTMGEKTKELEEKFAEYIGTEYAVFVNSGSSALLLMLASLAASETLKYGANLVIPSVSWSTNTSSAMFSGFNVTFVDCNLEDLSLDLEILEQTFTSQQVDAVMLVEVLGLVPNMDAIIALCKKYNVLLLEDTCESLGSEYKGKKLGSFGHASAFSMYYGHHMSTIEGGFVCTNDRKLFNVMRSQRSHGWDRDLDEDFRKALREEYKIDDFKSSFAFYYPSYNLRATEIHAFIGLAQLETIDKVVAQRNERFLAYRESMPETMWVPFTNGYASAFAYPVLCNITTNREHLLKSLALVGVDTRPIIAGNMNTQPFIKKHLQNVPVAVNATYVDKYGFYLPCHPEVAFEEIEMICDIIKEHA